MKAVNKSSKRVLDHLTNSLEAGTSRKSDNTPGVYMPVCVEHLYDCEAGSIFSVSHYFEQNGDLVPDPDMTFLRDRIGEWYPMTFQNSLVYRVGIEVVDGAVTCVNTREQADEAKFTNLWMKNIKEQQGL